MPLLIRSHSPAGALGVGDGAGMGGRAPPGGGGGGGVPKTGSCLVLTRVPVTNVQVPVGHSRPGQATAITTRRNSACSGTVLFATVQAPPPGACQQVRTYQYRVNATPPIVVAL